jgi:hypothetical protein
MGQKVNPIGFRLPITRDWSSKWYASRKDFADYLLADGKIREFLHKKLRQAAVSRIVIERAWNSLRVTIHTARPGVVIGRKGDADLVVSNQHVSRRHAKVIAATEGYQLVDLGSTYGTFVNSRRVERCVLKHGDRIVFGKDQVEFRYLVGDTPPPAKQNTTAIIQKSLVDLNRVLPSAASDLEKMLCVLDFQYQWNQVFTPENGLQHAWFWVIVPSLIVSVPELAMPAITAAP